MIDDRDDSPFQPPADVRKLLDEQGSDPRDAALGAELREKAIDQVVQAADGEWLEKAYQAALYCISNSTTGTTNTDDWWGRLGQLAVLPPRERRAMAGVVRRLQREGFIAKTERFIQSAIPQGHSRNVQVWAIVKVPEGISDAV